MIRLHNIRLYTGESYFPCAAVLVDGKRIVYAGEASGCPSTPDAEQIDGRGALCMPGFYNAHCHAAMTLERGVGSDLKLMDWLQRIFPIEDRLTGEYVYWGTLLATVEMLRRGVVGVADHYFYMDRVAQAALDSGMRMNISRACNEKNGIDSVDALYHEWNGAGDGLVNVYMGIHSEYLTTPEVVSYAIERAQKLGTGMHVHMSETADEVKACYDRHGVSPVRYFQKLGMYDLPTIAAHCVHLSDADIEILARCGVYAAHNPASNMKLGSGVARIPEMISAGVKVALGTDGPSSNNRLDMLADMRLAALIQKGVRQDATLMNAAQCIRMATVTGAQALGFGDCGYVRAGCQADMILLDGRCENLALCHDPLADIVFAAQGLNVTLTMVAGKVLYRNGCFAHMDVPRIVARAREAAYAMGVIQG